VAESPLGGAEVITQTPPPALHWLSMNINPSVPK